MNKGLTDSLSNQFRTPQLNGKVEWSHRADQTEFYQLLTYTDDVDLNAKLKAWESFNYYDHPSLLLDQFSGRSRRSSLFIFPRGTI